MLPPPQHHPLRLTYIQAAMERACLRNHHEQVLFLVQLHGKLDEGITPPWNESGGGGECHDFWWGFSQISPLILLNMHLH